MNKDLIRKRFSKNLETYSENAVIQRKMALKLMSYLNNTKFNNILEVGCGTGFLTELADKNLEFQNYTAIDIVYECENYVKNINSDITFLAEDIEKFLSKNAQKYDLIISNASLQWVDDFEQVLKNLLNSLNPYGILLFSTFGRENFREISFLSEATLDYLSVSDLKKMFSDFDTIIEEELHIMSFKSPKEVLKHFQLTGVNAINSEIWTKKDLKNFENGYNNFCSNRISLTYNPIYAKITNTL